MDVNAGETLKLALEFDENKRPLFKDISTIFNNEKKRKKVLVEKEVGNLEEVEAKVPSEKLSNSKSYDSSPSSTNLSKSRGLKKNAPNKTSAHGFKGIHKVNRETSSSPSRKRKNSANSPEKSFCTIS